MAKTYRNFYDKIYHPLNLWTAYKNAARGKRYKSAAAYFEYNLEKNLIEIEKELASESYQPKGYKSFYVQKPKKRLINAAPFRDRVVHHALMNIIEPFFERQFIFDSYANRKGKGTHKALDRCTHYLRRNAYVMHLDIRQFFPSIDHKILLGILARTIGDKQAIGLIEKIIASGDGIQANEYKMVYFPNDDIFASQRPRGLPIGNLTSQHWANVYLNELDQYVKRILKSRAYIRYVDDFLLFAKDKKTLHQWKENIILFLEKLRLTIHETKAQPRPVHTGIPFLGFQVFPNHRRLKSANGYAFQHRLKNKIYALKSGKIMQDDFSVSLQSWINHAGHGDTWKLRQSILEKTGIYGGLNE